jgi:hypothetical protein
LVQQNILNKELAPFLFEVSGAAKEDDLNEALF